MQIVMVMEIMLMVVMMDSGVGNVDGVGGNADGNTDGNTDGNADGNTDNSDDQWC